MTFVWRIVRALLVLLGAVVLSGIIAEEYWYRTANRATTREIRDTASRVRS